MLLVAEHLRYPAEPLPGAQRVFDGVNLVLEAGELVDVVGPSGSGKTTLLRALARLLEGVGGTLVFAGAAAESVVPAEWRRHIALVPQQAVMRPGTVAHNLLLPWALRVRAQETAPDADRLREALDSVGLHEIALNRDAAKLSVGQAARIALLRVALTAPDILLLDEPDANLDDASAEQVRAMTERFVGGGGAAVRVRHLRTDDLAARRLCLSGGRLTGEA